MKSNYLSLKSFRYNILGLLIILLYVGCKKFLEIPPPKTDIETSNVFTNSTTANATVLAIYSKTLYDRGLPYTLSMLTGLASDELKNNAVAVPDIATFYNNNLNSLNGFLYSDYWSQGYNFIYSANSIIDGVKSSGQLSSELKNQLTGEAKFIRAFWYFNLVNLFGDVPLIISTDYALNASSSRTAVSEIYQQIIADLKEAKTLLHDNYIDVDGVTTTFERARPNKSVASALLSRVYLYTNDWPNAESEATGIINNSAYRLVSIDSVFLKNNNETILAFQPNPGVSYSTPEGYGYILNGTPATGSSLNSATISPTLINAFESNDIRKTKWIGVYSTYMFPYKYKVKSGTSLTEYSVVLRLAEQFLIRAEARAQQNKLAEGLQDVNKVRSRAGLTDTSTANKDVLLNIILHERQVEMFSEYGHRWFDLKRTGKIDQIMTSVAPQKGATWSSYKSLFPIPQKELDSDPNLKQNPGY